MKKVNGRRRLMNLSLGAATLFVGLSILPAHASIPGTATATGSVDYTIQSPGWSMACIITDTGNLYAEGGSSSPLAIAMVNWGSTPKSRSGTVTYDFTFTWSGAPPSGLWKVNFTANAYAYFERIGQTAHAQAKMQIPFLNLTSTAEATAQFFEVPVSTSSPDQTYSFTPPGLTVKMGVDVEADVSTP